jgi:hypothetical protein
VLAQTLGHDNSVHVIRTAGAPALRALGARNVATFDDWLAWGPCDEEPETHAMLRRQFWNGDDERAAAATDAREVIRKVAEAASGVAGPVDVVIWTSDTWSDRLSLLWFMDAVLGRPDIPMIVRIVDAPSTPSGRAYQRRVRPRALTIWPVEQLRIEWAKARTLPPQVIRRGRRLWRQYAARCPLQFDRQRQTGFRALPLMNRVSHAYRLLFPRLALGRVRLSAFDEAILSPLLARGESGWHKASSVVSLLATSAEIDGLGSERAVWERLHDWAYGSPALDVRSEPREGVREKLCRSYRLTDCGRRMLAEGLATTFDAPVLYSGGCRLYGGSPWVLKRDGTKWNVARCKFGRA